MRQQYATGAGITYDTGELILFHETLARQHLTDSTSTVNKNSKHLQLNIFCMLKQTYETLKYLIRKI